MVGNRKPGHLKNRTILLATGLVASAFAIGFVFAAGITFTTGGAENGLGSSHTTTSPAWWSETSVGIGTQGVPPTTLSSAVGTPTVLAAASASYDINTGTAGDWVHFWKFQETTGAPTSTELELQFTVVESSTTVQTTAYVETQTTAPGSTLTFTVYYDLGSATVTLNSVVEVAQTCSAVGTCP
jgi:hypothetical protein